MNKAKNLDSILEFSCIYSERVECFVIIKKGEIVGPKTIKIEISLNFDDEQNEEMESVMINVREIKCHVREV